MANGQMDMADASAAPTPEQMAIYDQMRQEISPKQFSDEMLAGAEQIDPQAVAQFREELGALDIPPEVLDILNDLVDEILANPANYAEIRQKYMDQGAPGDILPEEFDPNFFAAFNMAIDQMIAAPSGPQAFAKGGIAELTPISKAISGYGRNGDTMLAHITPAEARMLRRRGGSGTTNPSTGLPEFWNPFEVLGDAISGIGKAVKSFVKSSVGKIVTTVALGFFLGPAAASFLGVTSAAGVAAVGGFLGSSGATLLGGGSLSDALKAGAIGGLTAGATAGVMGGADSISSGSYKGPTTVGGQVDAFKGMLPGGAAPPPVDTAPIISPTGEVQGLANVPSPEPKVGWGKSGDVGTDIGGVGKMPPVQAPSTTPLDIPGAKAEQGMLGKVKDFYSENISPSGIQKAGEPAAQKAGAAAMDALKARIPTATPTMLDAAYQTAYKSALPGMLSTYGPMAGLGLGALALSGGFETKPVQGGEITKSLNTSAAERMRQKGTQRENYVQSLPGVVYDKYGEPIYGKSTPLPTYDVPDYSGGYSTHGAGGGMRLPPVYMPPTGAIGSSRVSQPYNTSDMYSNLMPRTYADGGAVEPFGYAGGGTVTDLYRSVLNRDPSATEISNWQSQFGDSIDEAEMARFREAAGPELAIQKTEGDALRAEQKAARTRVAQQKAMRRAQGSGTMYANINAGLASNAPEINPMDPTDITFGTRNRQTQQENLQANYGSMIGNQRDALAQQRRILQPQEPVQPPAPQPLVPTTRDDRYSQMVQDQYARFGRTGFGEGSEQIDVPGFNWWADQLRSGKLSPDQLRDTFNGGVQDYMSRNPNDRYTQRMRDYLGGGEGKVSIPRVPPPEEGMRGYWDWEKYGTAPPTDRSVGSAADDGRGAGVSSDGFGRAKIPPGEFGHMGIDQYGRGYGQGFNTAPPTDGRLHMSSGPGYIPPQEEENAPIFGVAPPRPFIPAPMSPGVSPGGMPPVLPPQPIEGGGNDAGQPGGGWGAKDVSDKAGFWGANPGWAGWHEKALSLVPFDTQEKRDEQLAIDMSRTIGPSTTTAAEQATKNTLADEMRAAEHGTGALGPTMDVSNTKEGWGKSGDVSVDIGGITGLSSDGRDSFGGGFGGFGGDGNGSGGGYMATGGMVGHYALGGLMAQPYGNMPPPMNTGGIAALGTGGYPRRTGQINGPGTGKSDSIPAMLSDGEFVMTAKAVRAAGKGDRRAGAKRMYKLMHQLEKNSERG